jgi:hypothetical protein
MLWKTHNEKIRTTRFLDDNVDFRFQKSLRGTKKSDFNVNICQKSGFILRGPIFNHKIFKLWVN